MLGDSRSGSGGFCRSRAALKGHSKTEAKAASAAAKLSAAGAAIGGGDSSRYTSDESPRSREVVNPHTWPVRAKIAKMRRGQNIALGAGHQPTQTNTGVGEERV